jgi:hypothetical protein
MMLLLCDHYPMKTLCEVLGVARSSVYYSPRPAEDRSLRDALIEVAGRWPTYGYRRLTKATSMRKLTRTRPFPTLPDHERISAR